MALAGYLAAELAIETMEVDSTRYRSMGATICRCLAPPGVWDAGDMGGAAYCARCSRWGRSLGRCSAASASTDEVASRATP
jgi:hypothetical protein